jgi:cell division septation protein DedD
VGTGDGLIAKHNLSRARLVGATILIALAATLPSPVTAQRDKVAEPCDEAPPPGFRPIAALPEGPWFAV